MNRAFNNNDDEDIRNETLTNISNPSSHDILVLPLGVHSNPISSSCYEQNKKRIIQKKTRSACFTKAKQAKNDNAWKIYNTRHYIILIILTLGALYFI